MMSSLCPAGLPAWAPATPALSSWARLSQPPQLVQLISPTGHRMPFLISFPIEVRSTGVPCRANAEMTCWV